MVTLLANEINAKDRDVTGPTEQVEIMFPLRIKLLKCHFDQIIIFFFSLDFKTMLTKH